MKAEGEVWQGNYRKRLRRHISVPQELWEHYRCGLR